MVNSLASRRFAHRDSEFFSRAGEPSVTDVHSSAVMLVNSAPVIEFAPIYASDFETPDDVVWTYHTFGDDQLDIVPVGDDGTGNNTLVSQGPWWTDPNHISPGAGRLHLLSTLYVNGTNDGIVIDDLRDVTVSFDIKAEQLVIPAGAHLYLWFQSLDTTLPWGVGQFVNYAHTGVKIDELLVANGWAHVSITLTQLEADWLALGSNPDREGTYSISDSIVSALSGDALDFGLIMLMGNGAPTSEASGVVRLDNVVIEHGEILRVKYTAAALIAGLQPLNFEVNISDPDVTTFEGYRITVGFDGGGLASETLGFLFAPGSGLSVASGALYLNAAQIGTVTGGSGGTSLVIDITAQVAASVLDSLVASLAYRNQSAAAGQVRELLVGLDDGQGGTVSFAAEIIARIPPGDGSGNDHLIGSGMNETLNGGLGTDLLEGAGGDDRLYGGPGTDTTKGGTGDDWHFVEESTDIVIEAVGEGALDRVFASVTYTLKPGVHVEILSTVFNAATTPIDLTGNEFNNAVYGNAGANRLSGAGGDDALIGFEGNDILDGGLGADFSLGGTGDDWHYIDNAGDIVAEAIGEGSLDRLFAAVSYTLTAGAEIEIMSTTSHAGTAAINLTGNEFANTIFGNAGDNVLTGGAGADTLVGWAGNDWFYVDNAADKVLEAVSEGSDRLFASVSYTLAAGVEIELISTTQHGGTAPINLTGNALANTIYGNAGDNVLNGGAGADTLIGWAGNDWFYIDNAADFLFEAVGGGALDRAFTSVSFTLSADAEIEVFTTTNHGGTAAINLTGNEFANSIYGNNGINVLDGKGGNDILTGSAGGDSFAFTTGLGTGNVDRIVDFVSGSDKIALDDAVFAQVGGLGALNANAFHTGAAAHDLDDRIIYNSATGQLFYDADGNGAGTQILFATLDGNAMLAASDFVVI